MTEMELFIEHARRSGNYPVLDFYNNSWLPLKASSLREAATHQPVEEDPNDDRSARV